MVQENACKTIIPDIREQKVVIKLLNKKREKVKGYIMPKF